MKGAFSLEVNQQGIALLSFDLKEEKVNKLTEQVLRDLQQVLQHVSQNKAVRALLIFSGKKHHFIAGADIALIEEIHSAKQGQEKALQGQKILQGICDLKIPTFTLIDGACLGGGLELALCCKYRFVSDHPKTILGLPEVNLGIIPGFGGTQRLPRLVGLRNALPLILNARSISASKAFKIGLADACFPSEFALEYSLDRILNLIEHPNLEQKMKRKKRSSFLRKVVEENFITESLMFYFAKRQVLKKTKGNYPAPLVALRAIKRGRNASLGYGLKNEAKEFGLLAQSTLCKNLIQLFYTHERLKKDPGSKEQMDSSWIKKIGIMGAGLMGGGISWLFVRRGFFVRIKDIRWEPIQKAMETAHGCFQALLKRKRIDQRSADLAMLQISPTLDYSGFKHVDFALEAIFEDLEVKKRTLKELESYVGKDCVIASNTSSLSISEMAKELEFPQRFLGMHFFSPVHRMPLVEIIAGDKTSQKTLATAVHLVKKLKKTPVVVKDCPGFLINRILIPYVNEAVYLLQDGMDIATIDHLAEDYGMPLGPLSLADEVGLDIGYKVAKILENAYGKRMKTAGIFFEIHKRSHLLGKKTSRGFYAHKKKGKKPNKEVERIIQEFRLKYSHLHYVTPKEALDRMILTMVNEAVRCLEENVVADAKYLDMAMIMGTGFPPFRGGLLRYAQEMGLDYINLTLSNLSHKFGDRFQAANLLVEMASKNKSFY